MQYDTSMAIPCRNCGQPTGPRFCGHCGQEVEARRGPLFALVGEMLTTWFSVDGRLLRTLRMIVRPGRLTRQYLNGKRAPYLRPLRLYLVMSLLLFSSVLTLQAPDAERIEVTIAGESMSPPTEEGADLDAANDANGANDANDANGATPGRERLTISLLEKDSFLVDYFNARPDNRIERLKDLPPQELLDALFASLRRVLPAAMILFLPFLALALKILYLRTGTLFVDHLVFAVHFQSAMFLALALTWLVIRLVSLALIWTFVAYFLVILLVLLVYLPMALHHVYAQSRWWTGAKTVVLLFVYSQLLKLVLGMAMFWVIWSLT
jgi:hypothetical protein